MESNRESPPRPPAPAEGPGRPGAELIVENGRLAGTRRPLASPLAVVGRAAGCDIRLNVDGVAPLHCVLVQGPEGLVLRDLGSPGGSLVNDEPATAAPLNDGDVLGIGPFRFRLSLPASSPSGLVLRELESLEREKDALRVQAAAVAAQQAALTEAEAQLDQRRHALKRQEEQLARHLDQRRQRLLSLQETIRAARNEWEQEKTAFEGQRKKAEQELEQTRQDLARQSQDLGRQRGRLLTFRDRLKRHYERQFEAERGGVSRREAELRSEAESLRRERERLEQTRTALQQSRLELNGERELGRRALQDGWDQLHREHKQWQERQTAEQAELNRQSRSLRQREESLAEREAELVEQQRYWIEVRAALQREAEGLENRARNTRRKVDELELDLKRLGQQQADETPVAARAAAAEGTEIEGRAAPGRPEPPADLGLIETLTGDLADQRRQLAEQCERFVALQEQWRQGRDEIVREAEAVLQQLRQREEALLVREQAAAATDRETDFRRAEAERTEQRLEGRHARLAALEVNWQAERSRVLADVQTREELVGRQREFLLALRDRWAKRRRGEMRQVRAELELTLSLRQRYAGLWEECFRRRVALDHEQRSTAEQRLALEQLRLELLGQTIDSAAADRRLQKLRQRCREAAAASERHLARERKALDAEAARLASLAVRLQEQAADVTRREEDLNDRQADWDEEQTQAEAARVKTQQELQSLKACREHTERQVRQLGDELERVARLLIDGDRVAAEVAQAA